MMTNNLRPHQLQSLMRAVWMVPHIPTHLLLQSPPSPSTNPHPNPATWTTLIPHHKHQGLSPDLPLQTPPEPTAKLLPEVSSENPVPASLLVLTHCRLLLPRMHQVPDQPIRLPSLHLYILFTRRCPVSAGNRGRRC